MDFGCFGIGREMNQGFLSKSGKSFSMAENARQANIVQAFKLANLEQV